MGTGGRLVAVSGGFDPIHDGHTRMIEAARACGDRLMVIVNNDNWLRTKKGYVFMPEAGRMAVIQALRAVDSAVLTKHVPNDSDMSVCRTLAEIRPDVFANGGDRGEENTPERMLCEQLGIEMVYNVGGGKIQSSSWMTAAASEAMHTHFRPWGSFRNLYTEPGRHVKTLHVNARARLSLQRHQFRQESWMLIRGDAQATSGADLSMLVETELAVDVPFYVPAGTIHRLSSRNGATLVEISYGTFDEDDIERFQDDFGRVA